MKIGCVVEPSWCFVFPLSLTPKEREIIGYLLPNSQRMFCFTIDGGAANTLVSKRLVVCALLPGQSATAYCAIQGARFCLGGSCEAQGRTSEYVEDRRTVPILNFVDVALPQLPGGREPIHHQPGSKPVAAIGDPPAHEHDWDRRSQRPPDRQREIRH
jgi:hypothetical protein